jgi:hypothetical protein
MSRMKMNRGLCSAFPKQICKGSGPPVSRKRLPSPDPPRSPSPVPEPEFTMRNQSRKRASGLHQNTTLTRDVPEAQKKGQRHNRQSFEFLVGAREFVHYVSRITRAPASAPLRSLARPSLAAFPTFSRRSLRFESSLCAEKNADLKGRRYF